MLYNLWFADDIDLLGGSEEEQQQTERLEKTSTGSIMEISSDKSKILLNSIQAKTIYQHMDEWKNAGRSGSVQILGIPIILGIPTYQRWNIIKGTKDQIHSDMARLAVPWKNKAIIFFLQRVNFNKATTTMVTGLLDEHTMCSIWFH